MPEALNKASLYHLGRNEKCRSKDPSVIAHLFRPGYLTLVIPIQSIQERVSNGKNSNRGFKDLPPGENDSPVLESGDRRKTVE